MWERAGGTTGPDVPPLPAGKANAFHLGPAYRFVMNPLTAFPDLCDLALEKMPAAEAGPPGYLLTMREKDCPVISGEPAPKLAGGCHVAVRCIASKVSVSN